MTAPTLGMQCTTTKRRRGVGLLASVTAVMLAHEITPADCFGGLKEATRPVTFASSRISSLHFRSPTDSQTTSFHSSSFTNDIVSTPAQELAQLPTWLAGDRSHLVQENMLALTDFMRDSFFTENETLKMKKAIEDAAAGDRNLAAGAAEFCLLLAETMEMGLNALTAAAFHYCSCVNLRKGVTEAVPLQEWYGSHVVNIVADAARLKQLEMVAPPGIGRDEAENLRHLLLTETNDWRALAIRSAASLYRLRGIISSKQTELTRESVRASREALNIYAPLASRLGMHRLKNELENAAFRILYRRQYEAVHSYGRGGQSEMSVSMGNVLDSVKSEMTDMLMLDVEFQKQVSEFQVTARVKEPYSMWKKMLRLGCDHVLQVPDALALRIVLKAKKLSDDEPVEVTRARERALCYYAQKLCRDRWHPVASDPRFKDYIEKPKTNGYQSLHYTAQTWFEEEDWTLEVQVRSAEMHQVAEFGLAAHWDYKAATKQEYSVTVEADQSDDAYLRNVQQWHWKQHGGTVDASPASFEPVVSTDIWQSRERAERIRSRTERLQPYLQALTNAQSDLAKQHVFVFLVADAANNKVLALPAGACVLDAIRTEGMGGASVNGQDVPDTRRLQNGDILKVAAALTPR